jgi:hypothetical protein
MQTFADIEVFDSVRLRKHSRSKRIAVAGALGGERVSSGHGISAKGYRAAWSTAEMLKAAMNASAVPRP